MGRNDERRRDRRFTKETRDTKPSLSLGDLCAIVSYHYGLTPKQVAEFSGPQLIMWYKTAMQEIGSDKNLDLAISVVPHTKDPQKALSEMRHALIGKS